MSEITLPLPSGELENYPLTGEPVAIEPRQAPSSRRVLAAAHVVIDPLRSSHPGKKEAIDWQATLAYRSLLLEMGLGIAESMDTAQRGMGLGWSEALQLAKRCLAEFGPKPPAPIFAGAGTDQLASGDAKNLNEVADAYLEQIDALQAEGSRLILMASSELARLANTPEDYAQVYAKTLDACSEPVIIHWLGDMFAPALAGYWGCDDLDAATESCLEIINANASKIEGIKMSLLDQNREIAMRRKLPRGVRMYTGDDFNYPELIAGDELGHSDALLGIFDSIAPIASAALAKLDAGDAAGFRGLLDPTVELARLIFSEPTYHYKVGVVFLAWLNGHQQHFSMLGGVQGMRSINHFAQLFRLADGCGLLADPEEAARRMARLLALYGVDQ